MKSFPKGSHEKVGKWFKAFEFDCSCQECSFTFIDETLVSRLDQIRDSVGAPLVITSGYRCDHHQNKLKESGHRTAVGRSTHQDGKAADIRCKNISGADLANHAEAVGFKAIGIANSWIHVDTRTGKRRRWTY
jgi:zinc D-Ala-D-Ala carboxypeptidase